MDKGNWRNSGSFFIVLLGMMMSAGVYGQGVTRKVVDVPEVRRGVIKVDGKMDEGVWKNAAHADIYLPASNTSEGMFNKYYSVGDTMTKPDYKEIYGRMLWSPDTLYLFYHVHEVVTDLLGLNFKGKFEADQILVCLSDRLEQELLEGAYNGAPYAAPDGPYHFTILGSDVTLNGGDPTWVPQKYRSFPDDTMRVFRASDFARSAVYIDTLNGIWDVEMAIYNPGIKPSSFIGFNLGGSNAQKKINFGAPYGFNDYTYSYYTWNPCVPNKPYDDPTGTNDPGYFSFVTSKYWNKLNFIPNTDPGLVWEFPVKINDNFNITSGTLTLGTSYKATDGIDPILGEETFPPAPPAGIFDIRFKLPVTPSDFSRKDYRRDTLKSVTWTLQFQPGKGGYPMTFSWDPNMLPQEGSFCLKDAINGTIINIDMRTHASYVLSNENINTLKIEYRKNVTTEVNVASDWSIVSVPVVMSDMKPQSVFPGITSNPFYFSDEYLPVLKLETSKGYWIRYSQPSTIKLTGAPVISGAIPIKEGWNLIGIYDKNIPVKSITTIPSGIITSSIFGYSDNYFAADTLRPGKGYWVRSAQSGTIQVKVESKIPTSSGVKVEVENKTKSEMPLSKLIVEDNDGNRGVLYVIDNIDCDLSEYDLPPVPPAGIFDVRYASDRMAEKVSADFKINSAVYPLKITAEGTDIKLKDAINGSMINTIIKNGHSVTISNNALDKFTIESLSSSVPLNYELYQNYPNPFNPSTKIIYSLAKDSHVTLKIYNALGETVRQLVDGFQLKGRNEIELNAADLSSGIYFYEIKASPSDGSVRFKAVKKLLLLK